MWAEWHDSEWECLVRIVQPCKDWLCEKYELFVEDKWVTYGIYIWFCGNLLMWVVRVGVQ